MKRILSLLMALCLMLCMAAPVMAQDMGGVTEPTGTTETRPGEEPGGTVENTTEETAPADDAGDGPALGGSGGGQAATPTQADEPGTGPEIDPDATVQSITADGGVILPMSSGWTGEGSEFFTRIRILVSDRETGAPISGAVYGLYTASGSLVQYLTTDAFGVATSDDVSVYSDYYLEEYSTPAGFLPNYERKDIILSEECAPSRVDVYAEYDPITGYIEVIKTDEDGNAMQGVTFNVYRYSDGAYVDTITTDGSGRATTGPHRYGWYDLYEEIPEGYGGSSYYDAYIDDDGETVELNVVNYYARGSLRVYKYGEDGRAIPGAVFSIYRIPRMEAAADSLLAYDMGGEWLMDITTNGSGYAYAYDLLAGYDYYAVEKSVPAPYRLDSETVHDFYISYDGEYVYLDIENEIEGDPGTVTVVKTDDSANPLDGVVFGLFRAWDNKRLETLTTANGGLAQSGPLPPSDYYLLEESGVEGYTPITGQIPFTIDGSGEAVVLPLVNPKIRVFGKVEVEKVDDAGNPIPGVTFGIYCVAKDKLLGELVTGEDGRATSGVLNAGDYYLLERGCDPIPGYIISTERHPFTIDEDGETVTVTVVNPRISGAVKVIKTGDSGEALPGVVFGIFLDGGKIEELTTAEDGTATSGTLYYGSGYELRELSTVEGYELLDTPIPFSILEQDVVLEIPVTNPLILGGVTVIKISEPEEPAPAIALYSEDGEGDGYEYLDGAVFGLYNAAGQKIAELVTENGRASYTGLPVGLYYLLELQAPEAHVLSGDMIAFRIDGQGQMVEKVVTNAKGYGTLELFKTGEGGDNDPLPGVTFDVYRAADDEKVGELVTNEDGRASITLPLGRYYLLETATAELYALLPGPVSFTLTEDGAVVELSISNQKAPAETGTLRLTKVDADDNTLLLPGATFGVYRASDDVKVAEITTASDGQAAVELPENDYYLLEQKPPASYAPSEERHSAAVVSGETTDITMTNTLLPPDTGTVKIVKKSESDGELLAGAVFGVFNAGDDMKVGELTTGDDGAATLEIGGGDFYLLELVAPDTFRLSTAKTYFTIAAGETKTFTLYNRPEDEPEDEHNLVIIKSAQGTGERLEGAVFGVYRKSNNEKVAELTTSENGVASMTLEKGNFYLRELRAPRDFVAEPGQIPFSISSADTVVTINVTNTRGMGTVKLIKTDDEGSAVAGAVFAVYEWDGKTKLTEITTGSDGTATCELPVGPYYLVEKSVPSDAYRLSDERHRAVIEAGETTEVKVVNELVRGTVNVYFKHMDDGRELADMRSLTDKLGTDYVKWMRTNGLESLTINGYTHIRTDYPASLLLVDGTLTVILWYDGDGGITIPKTGEAFPTLQYGMGALCLAVAGLCGAALLRRRRKRAGT